MVKTRSSTTSSTSSTSSPSVRDGGVFKTKSFPYPRLGYVYQAGQSLKVALKNMQSILKPDGTFDDHFYDVMKNTKRKGDYQPNTDERSKAYWALYSLKQAQYEIELFLGHQNDRRECIGIPEAEKQAVDDVMQWWFNQSYKANENRPSPPSPNYGQKS